MWLPRAVDTPIDCVREDGTGGSSEAENLINYVIDAVIGRQIGVFHY
jgi:hypothetical protein